MKQSIINSKYLLFCQSYPKLKIVKLNGKTYHQLIFQTRTLECLKEFYSDFYQNGKKIVPRFANLYDYLTYEMLAHWIKGKGTRKDNA
jgi:hypothetical protein